MAVLFEKVANGRVYQVRSAGNSRRLYTDGVFHSQYNPNHIITGSVWDLLFLPSQFYVKGANKPKPKIIAGPYHSNKVLARTGGL